VASKNFRDKSDGSDALPQKNQKREPTSKPRRNLVDHALMNVLTSPIRVRILAILAERPASCKELAEELDEPAGNVAHHVRMLRREVLVEQDSQRVVKSAIERFYRGRGRTILPANAWDDLPSAARQSVSADILKEFLSDAQASIEVEIFDDPMSDLSWVPLVLDSLGVKEVEELVNVFLESVIDAQAKASVRLASLPKDKANAVSATVFLASFPSTRSLQLGLKAAASKRR
jgi:DNA-binding transcriptional ArsR family regulator